MTVGVEIYPIAIGIYDQLPQLLDVDAEVDRVKALLADFDANLPRPWDVPTADRGGDAIAARLEAWSSSSGGPTLLYWVGHGWSGNRTAALAHARSAKRVGTTGVSPSVLADHIVRWEAQTDGEPWLLGVFDACKSARVAELVAAELDNLGGRRCVVLLGTSAKGSTILGRLSHELLTVPLSLSFGFDTAASCLALGEDLRCFPWPAKLSQDSDL